MIDAELLAYLRDASLLRETAVMRASRRETARGNNTLWHGRVTNLDDHSTDTFAIGAFNNHLHEDTRVDISLIPIGDGLTVARKR